MPSFAVIFFNPENGLYEFVNGPNANKTFDGVDGTDANAAACLLHDRNGKYVAFAVAGHNKATFQTAFETPLNTNLVFTAKTPGVAGNSIRIRYVVATGSQALSIAVAGNDITVNIETTAGTADSTANEVLTALTADSSAMALIDVALAQGENGSGIIPSGFSYTNLQYGSDGAAVATNVEQVETTSSSPTTY